MALRVSKAEHPAALSETMIEQFGAVPEPVEVTWHNPKVATAAMEFGGKVGEWDTADECLKSFAHMAVAAQVGCSWCLDIGYCGAAGPGRGSYRRWWRARGRRSLSGPRG